MPDSVYILLSGIISDRNCYTSTTTGQTGLTFLCNGYSSNTQPECMLLPVTRWGWLHPILTTWEIYSWTSYELFVLISARSKLYLNCRACLSPPPPLPLSKIPSVTAGLTAERYQPLRAVSLNRVFPGQHAMCQRVTATGRSQPSRQPPAVELSRNLGRVCFCLLGTRSFFDILPTPTAQPIAEITALPESAGFASFVMRGMY